MYIQYVQCIYTCIEGNHGFIYAILWVGIVVTDKLFLHCSDDGQDFLQPMVAGHLVKAISCCRQNGDTG